MNPPGGTLHVVDRLSEPVFSVLGPGTAMLQEAGAPQTVVLIDRAEDAHRLTRFSDGVRLVPVATARPAWRHWAALRRAVREEMLRMQPSAVHFHGALARLWSAGLVGHPGRKVWVSTHGSALSRWGAFAPAQVDGVVDAAFFMARHRESRRPLIVSGCHDDNRKAVELFCRAAVIFGAAELKLAFNWCGPVTDAAAARLKAAGIGTAPALDDAALASRLESAWVYFAGGGEALFPIQLAQAMACGLPCLAADAPAYRGVVEDGVAGLLYRSEQEALQLLTVLIDDRALRQRLGEAARHAALQRFCRQRLRLDLLALYRDAAVPAPALEPQDGSQDG